MLFVAPVINTRRAVLGQPIWYIDGSEKGCEETRTTYPTDLRQRGHVSRETTSVRQSVNVEATCISPAFDERSLAVAVEAQTLSCDFVPNFKRPFATNTVSHIVEGS